MATKPTTLPEWASSVGAEITAPTLSKKQTGWVVEAPPHNYFNWWMNLVWQWLVYLDAFLTDAHTWLGLQTFSGGMVVNGGATVNGGLNSPNGGDLHGMTLSGSATVTGGILTDFLTATSSASLPVAGMSLLSNPGLWAPATGHPKPTRWKDYSGAVHIEGRAVLSGASATGFLLDTLPAGWRPATDVNGLCLVQAFGASRPIAGLITVNSAGQVFVGSLDGSTSVIMAECNFVFHPSVVAGP